MNPHIFLKLNFVFDCVILNHSRNPTIQTRTGKLLSGLWIDGVHFVSQHRLKLYINVKLDIHDILSTEITTQLSTS